MLFADAHVSCAVMNIFVFSLANTLISNHCSMYVMLPILYIELYKYMQASRSMYRSHSWDNFMWEVDLWPRSLYLGHVLFLVQKKSYQFTSQYAAVLPAKSTFCFLAKKIVYNFKITSFVFKKVDKNVPQPFVIYHQNFDCHDMYKGVCFHTSTEFTK